ncbi:MAG: hypothetical protein LBV08_01870 [Clostridiales bacterium]|nr:hypothetical protein [Clostridiales bacterium]
MQNINVYRSVVSSEIFSEFEAQRGTSLFNHSSNSNFIDDFISVGYVLCPDIIDVKGHVFIADFFNATGVEALDKLQRLSAQHSNDKKKIERWVNSWGFGDFFLGKYNASIENEKILVQFGELLVYNWSRRVKDILPDRNIIVEYGEGLIGEDGLAITLYEA